MSAKYSSRLQTTSQTEQAFDKPNQVKNNAGGFVFQVDDFERLRRFLILGSEGNTYYTSAQKLTQDNAKCVLRCATSDPVRTVELIKEVSLGGLAPKNDPAIFALALIIKRSDSSTAKALAEDAVNKVCRTGTHLFQFAESVNALGGWGRATKRIFSKWYNRDPKTIAEQITKYAQRDGWSHHDVLHLAHVYPASPDLAKLFLYAKDRGAWGEPRNLAHGGWNDTGAYEVISGVEAISKVSDPKVAAMIIKSYKLPREVVPTELLNSGPVWEALLPHMGLTAMIRNLGKMSTVGVLGPNSEGAALVIDKLGNVDQLRKARVHPIAILSALRTYGGGHGIRGHNAWDVNRNIMDALEEAFYTAFHFVPKTGKRFLLALDVSGSMDGGEIAGIPGLTPRDASVALALVTYHVESQCQVVTFSSGNGRGWATGGFRYATNAMDGIQPFQMSKKDTIKTLTDRASHLDFGRTDCALPMLYAAEKKIPVDCFVIMTDNETWAGKTHPFEALKGYRAQTGINAKLAVVGMTATQLSIADPSDAFMMDFVGFDASAPAVMADFASRG